MFSVVNQHEWHCVDSLKVLMCHYESTHSLQCAWSLVFDCDHTLSHVRIIVCVHAASTPWFEAYREAFLQMSYPSDHEFIRHYLACILCISDSMQIEAVHWLCKQSKWM